MRIRISAEPIGPLRVLPELPEARLAILEGLNGVGKTLAVRLLQVCVGDSPYPPRAAAWDSLCKGLGEFRVVASGLRGISEISWTGDSTDWIGSSAATSAPNLFREILIDGNLASLEEVRKVFRVYRLGGEEGLVDTFAYQADQLAEIVRLWGRRYADPIAGPLAELETIVGFTLRIVGDLTSVDYSGLRSGLERARQQVAVALAAVEAARARRDAISSALLMAQRLNDIRRRSPQLSEQLREVDSKIGELERERSQLQQDILRRARQLAAAGPLLRELSNASKTVERNRARLSFSVATAARLAMSLEIEPKPDVASATAARLSLELDALQAKQTELDAAPSMRALLDEVTPILVAAEGRGLAQQIAIDEPTIEARLTVAQTRVGMTIQRQSLEGKPPLPEAQQLADQMSVTSHALNGVAKLLQVLDEVARFQRLTEHNERRVQDVVATLNPNARTQLQTMEGRRKECDDQLLELAAQRAGLREQLGVIGDAADAVSLGEQLTRVLRDLKLTESELSGALAEAEDALELAQLALRGAQQQEAEARDELQHAEGDIRRASARFSHEDQTSWVRDNSIISAFERATTAEHQLAVLNLVRQRTEQVNDRLGSLRVQLAAIESALRSIARQLRDLEPDAREYVPELQRWLGARFSSWLNTGRVRSELFPNADAEVTVDVAAREVRWTENSAPLSRPLEAFSSGEQAYAYTRARLGVLDGDDARPANRLIILDEFGSFIAQDRLGALLQYLHEHADEHPNDQLLVILPLGQDYADLARKALKPEAEEYETLAAEIASKHYAVRVLEQ